MPELVELLVMLKAGYTPEELAPIAESVQAQLIETRSIFDKKIIGLLTVSPDAADAALEKLKNDNRIELAQVNQTYRHC